MPISKDSNLHPASDSESAIVDEHGVVPPAPLQVGQARPLTGGGVVELHAGQVLRGCGDPSWDEIDEHDDDGHVLGGQGEPSYDEHYDGQMTRRSHRTQRDPVGHSG